MNPVRQKSTIITKLTGKIKIPECLLTVQKHFIKVFTTDRIDALEL